jgi:hypothetical protein
MADDAHDGPRLPEDAAHRLLARAVELDAARAAEIPVARLREAAREAGISAAAFEAALAEAQAPPATAAAARGGRWETVFRNALAVVAFWGTLVLLVRLCRAADVAWQVRKAADVAALLVGAGVARRLGARVALFALAGLALAQGSEVAMDLLYGGPAVRGAGAHFALIVAGVGGVALGALLTRARRSSPPVAPAPHAAPADAAPGAAPAQTARPDSLRLGLGSRPASALAPSA